MSLMEILEQLKSKNLISDTSLVGVYCTVSLYYFVQSNYDEVGDNLQMFQEWKLTSYSVSVLHLGY